VLLIRGSVRVRHRLSKCTTSAAVDWCGARQQSGDGRDVDLEHGNPRIASRQKSRGLLGSTWRPHAHNHFFDPRATIWPGETASDTHLRSSSCHAVEELPVPVVVLVLLQVRRLLLVQRLLHRSSPPRSGLLRRPRLSSRSGTRRKSQSTTTWPQCSSATGLRATTTYACLSRLARSPTAAWRSPRALTWTALVVGLFWRSTRTVTCVTGSSLPSPCACPCPVLSLAKKVSTLT